MKMFKIPSQRCVCVRERERERQRDRQTDRQRKRFIILRVDYYNYSFQKLYLKKNDNNN